MHGLARRLVQCFVTQRSLTRYGVVTKTRVGKSLMRNAVQASRFFCTSDASSPLRKERKLVNPSESVYGIDNDDGQFETLRALSFLVVERIVNKDKQMEQARELINAYYESHPLQRYRYLCFLSEDFSTSLDEATHAVKSYLMTQKRSDPYEPAHLVERLRVSIRSQYMELFRTLSRLDIGVKFLIDLRGDLLSVIGDEALFNEQPASGKVYLRQLAVHLADLLSLFFSAGFVRLERVTWDSPTSILQKISQYEAVHPVANWLDLKNRLGLYRRCYMFSHSCLAGEPLVILHVALVPDISSSIQDIIQNTNVITESGEVTFHDALTSPADGPHEKVMGMYKGRPIEYSSFAWRVDSSLLVEDPEKIQAAIFYSISSTQKGLNGIDLGNQLIKKVAAGLQNEYPMMSQFSTLSPIPRFTEHLLALMQRMLRGDDEKNIRQTWANEVDLKWLGEVLSVDNEDQMWRRIIHLLRSGTWITDATLVELFRKPLMRCCAQYLHNEKRRGFALNSVANFHLKNGAVMWRLNWLADISTKGLSNSCGIMVNYRYYLDNYQENTEVYLTEQRIILGKQFSQWLE